MLPSDGVLWLWATVAVYYLYVCVVYICVLWLWATGAVYDLERERERERERARDMGRFDRWTDRQIDISYYSFCFYLCFFICIERRNTHKCFPKTTSKLHTNVFQKQDQSFCVFLRSHNQKIQKQSKDFFQHF
jgi:hypothetical protein